LLRPFILVITQFTPPSLTISAQTPPDGEFAVMNYRSTAEFKPPFRVYPTVEEVGPYMVDVIVKLRADFPSTNNAANVTLTLPLPKTTVKASCSLGPAANGQSVDYRESHRQCVWTLKKLAGGSEVTMRCRVTLPEEHSPNVKREMGPISMAFVIPMYNVSRLQVPPSPHPTHCHQVNLSGRWIPGAAAVARMRASRLEQLTQADAAAHVLLAQVRYLQIMNRGKAYNPYRWVRYITQSSSYACRI
jgi:AP-4 complex subunit mu-1